MKKYFKTPKDLIFVVDYSNKTRIYLHVFLAINFLFFLFLSFAPMADDFDNLGAQLIERGFYFGFLLAFIDHVLKEGLFK